MVLFPYTSIPNLNHYLLGLDVIAYPRIMFGFFFIQAIVVAYGFEKLVIDQSQWESARLMKNVSWFVLLVAGLGLVLFSLISYLEFDPDQFRGLLELFQRSIGSNEGLKATWLHAQLTAYSLRYFMAQNIGIFLWGLIKYLSLILLLVAIRYPKGVWKYLFMLALLIDVVAGWNFYTFQKGDLRSVTNASYESSFLSGLDSNDRVGTRDEPDVTLRKFYDEDRDLEIRWNLPSFWNVKTIEGSSLNLSPALFQKFWALESDNEYTPTTLRAMPSKIYDLMGLTYLFSSKTLDQKGFKKVGQGQRYGIYKNRRAVPRFYFAHQIRHGNEEIIGAVVQNELWNPLDETWVEGVAPLGWTPRGKDSGKNQITMVRDRYNDLALETDSDRDLFLATTEAFHPDWKVYVDGKKASLIKTNYYFRGVFLKAGEHEVRFVYRSRTFQLGVWISVLSLLILLLTLLFERKRGHRYSL